jgi:hypothetical protein
VWSTRLITRRRFLRTCLAAAGGAAGVGLYAWRVEPHWLEITERRLSIAGLPATLEGGRLVQISDLHVGPRVDSAYLVSALRAADGFGAELVVFTGDFVSYDTPADLEGLARVLEHFPRGRRATLGILGNHDYGPGWRHPEIAERVASRAAAAGITVLRNETIQVEGLVVVGLDDLWGPFFDAGPTLASVPPGVAALVLCHNPDAADLDVWRDYRGWILAGHTHGGQCKPPFLPPPILPVRNRRYTAGAFDLWDGRWIYISRGVGHLLPIRFNVRPEITVFRLTGKGTDAGEEAA